MPGDIRIENKDDLEKWLNSLPENIRQQAAIAIATRTALRALPGLERWLTAEEDNLVIHTLPVFRAAAMSWLMAMVPTHGMRLKRAASIIGRRGSPPDITYYSSFHAIAFAFTRIISIFTTHSLSFANNAATTAAELAAAAPIISEDSIWNAIEQDANALANNLDAQKLMKKSLWSTGTPDWAAEYWRSMKARLLAREGEHWEVWTNWYDARLDPSRRIPCYSPPDLKLEEARVLLPDELWEQGPAAVNVRIKAQFEESGCEIDPPPQMDGIRFRIDDEGRLDEALQKPDEDEASDPLLISMFTRLRQKLAALMQEMERIDNQYPTLNNVLRDYDAEISSITSLQDLDIPAVWMVGQGVMAQAEAFRNMADDALTPRLEPEVQGLLEEVAGLHGAFITGFRLGRVLTSRRLEAQAGPDAVGQLQEAEQNFIEQALHLPDEAMTPRVHHILSMIRDILLSNEIKVDERIGITISTIYNVIGVVGEWLDGFLDSRTAQFIGAGMGQAGLAAWAMFFQQAAGSIAAIAQITPEMRAYIHYLFERHGWQWPDDDEPAGE